ncbi:helix-turn-helix domain-containing protein [Mucilaginibacter arboris]|uniref:Helix-turn-helix domain-containing protein n=1 Tax=Mucilaginibacter arboris TaxID=2682090 RepID=A0A7K1SVA2_9SPHI|nr:helix-turn-helix transcriptional regulator [Mucilaginibacter arboris]MVN21256.1 helix-turn-helix domain-containing protein [Mucilaginibacter arboris]
MAETLHIGKKISRIRELRGMKQDALAAGLGISQQAISKLEQSENVEDETLEKVAKVLEVTADAIKNFNEEAAINYFNTFQDNSFSNSSYVLNAQSCNFNPLDKLIENYEENRKLYERLLQSEREKNELLLNQLKNR